MLKALPKKILTRVSNIAMSRKGLIVIFVVLLTLLSAWLISLDAGKRYESQLSTVIYDRHGTPISIKANNRGHYVNETTTLPTNFKSLLVKKEDRFFYYHLGINPISTVRAFYSYIKNGRSGGASTLTQQLAKNLLGTESKRNVANKLIEAIYAFSIEVFYTKEEILVMYANTAYLGNQIQGFETASYAYFNKQLKKTTPNEQLSLLATLSYPSSRNPWEKDNTAYAKSLNNRLTPEETFLPPVVTTKYNFQNDSYFELRTADINCESTCQTTIDDNLTEEIRKILNRNVQKGWEQNMRNGAVVVIDAKNSELISLVGSINPNSSSDGDQINMAIQPRPIGSTVKPFIYLKGFMEGLRPYTLVEDREYKYSIATGFSLYPKNYDGQYRGVVTLHEALSNSLNVPSVKTLEYIGLTNFYAFLNNSLEFKPIQDYDSYQYGIALGGLEMDLLTLTHYFSLFPQKGNLYPLRTLKQSSDNFNLPPQSNITSKQKVADEKYVELVHAIISDRFAGVNQFGLEGNLNLTTTDYGVKTGTSRDFHDSWVVGYTGDFVVGVWIGNSKNEALDQVSGSSGAGLVWHDVMELLLNSSYNRNTKLTRTKIEQSLIGNNNEWIIKGDVISEHQNLIEDDNLILSLHNNDIFELSKETTIPLKARIKVAWSINGENIGTFKETTFTPKEIGTYEIAAFDTESKEREILTIRITKPE